MRILFILFSLLLSVQAAASSIWKVSGHGKTFYLFGTIHVLKPSAYPLPAVYDETLAKCDELWLEVDIREMSDPSILGKIQQMMMLPTGQKLKDQLSASSYAELEKLAAEAKVPLAMLQGMKPWAAVNQLTLLIFQQHGFTAEGLDMHLQSKAQAQGTDIHAFETLMWQLDMFDTLAAAHSEDFVDFSTEDMDDVSGMVAKLYQYWQTGDYRSMYAQAQFDQYPQVEQVLLADRNRQWLQTLEQRPAEHTICAAVGALHMAGKDGLIAQFKARGYQVSQL